MRKEDLKSGIWYRLHIHELFMDTDDAIYLREGTYNYMLLYMCHSVRSIPKESLDVVYDENGDITAIHMRTGMHNYEGVNMEDRDHFGEEKMHDMIYAYASQGGKLLAREIYDKYRIDDNATELPIIDVHHHNDTAWLLYKADQIRETMVDRSIEFSAGFNFAIEQTRIWLRDYHAEPGTKVFNAQTGETFISE